MSPDSRPDKPAPIFPAAEQVPEELRPLKAWIGWKLIWDEHKNKICKPPYSPVDGSAIGATEKYSAHFLNFDEALAGAKAQGLDGVGFVFLKGLGYVGLDFDSCVADGAMHQEVANWLKNWFSDTYAEYSPSGTGVHVIARGRIERALLPTLLPGGSRVEAYSHSRYFTWTGRVIEGHAELAGRQAAIGKLFGCLGESAAAESAPRPMSRETALKFHAENLEALRNAAEGEGNSLLNQCAFFAARAFAAGALEQTAEQVKRELLGIVTKEWKSPHPEHGARSTIQSGWSKGIEQPLDLLEPEQALERIEALLGDTEAEADIEATLRDAALLSPIEYDRKRKLLASRLGFTRPKTFDQEIAKRRQGAGDDSEDRHQGAIISLSDVEPWPEQVDGAALLDELSASVRRYVHFNSPPDADAAALFTLGTYCFDLFDLFPFLGVTAPDENSGKTTLEKWVQRVAYRPLPTSNITPAALFRLIEMYRGTLIIDEMDTFLDPDSELYGILNSGHDKEMAFVVRTVGEDHEPRRFSTWCPRVWAMIGLPKRTVTSRSLVVRLLRKPKELRLERLPKVRLMGPEWERLRRQCARWASDGKDRLQRTEVDMESLANRAADNWEPLLIIAAAAGGHWPKRAREAAGIPEPARQESENTALLRDIRNILHTRGVDRIPSAMLAADLCEQAESPWPHYDHHNPLTVNQLAALLAGLGLRSGRFRLDRQLALGLGLKEKSSVRGYALEQFKDLFASYLPDEKPEKVGVSRVESFC